MKHILLLFTRRSTQGQSDPVALCQALTQAAAGSATYEYALYEDLIYDLNPADAHIYLPDGRPLSSFNAVYQRRWTRATMYAVSVALYLQRHGVPCIDTESAHAGSPDKLSQYWRMWSADLPFPRSVFVAPEHLADWLAGHAATHFTFPLIMKGIDSQRGNDNYLVHDLDEAIRIATENPKVPFIVQQFIPNDGDYRVLVCGSDVGLIVKRTSTGDTHHNNTSKGGSATLMPLEELSAKARADCVKAANTFGRDIAGVDIVFDKNDRSKYYFFEINRAPQIDHSSFTAEKAAVLHDYFMKLPEQTNAKPLKNVGQAERIAFPDLGLRKVSARIDTGAKTSAIWASKIAVENGELQVVLFDKQSPCYTGEVLHFNTYESVVVASSTGEAHTRYKVALTVRLGGRRIRASFTLADRSKQAYPVLIGRNVLRNKFVVDVSEGKADRKAERQRHRELQTLLEVPEDEENT